jgi:hypothetical protein
VLLLVVVGQRVIIVTDVETHVGRINIPVTGDEGDAEHWFGAKVKDTIEDSLGVRGDNVSSFADTPGNRVAAPDEECPNTADQKDAVHVGPEGFGVLAPLPADVPENGKHGRAAEGIESLPTFG